jgi:hypothetical protein
MQKWEYLFKQSESAKDVDSILDKAGEDGWELITASQLSFPKSIADPMPMTVQGTLWNFFFKRPKT